MRSSVAPQAVEVGEPDLDEWAHRLLEPGRTRLLERLLVARAGLVGVDALLEAVVPRDEQLLDPLARFVALHKATLTRQDRVKPTGVLMEAATNLPKSIRVLIADDHRLFAQALEAILVTDERIEIVGHARDGAEAVRLARRLDPDVILMDIAMPGMDGFEATREIRRSRSDACILMLTGSNSRSDVDRAREAGAAGYVTKDRIASELIDAITEVVDR